MDNEQIADIATKLRALPRTGPGKFEHAQWVKAEDVDALADSLSPPETVFEVGMTVQRRLSDGDGGNPGLIIATRDQSCMVRFTSYSGEVEVPHAELIRPAYDMFSITGEYEQGHLLSKDHAVSTEGLPELEEGYEHAIVQRRGESLGDEEYEPCDAGGCYALVVRKKDPNVS